MEKYNPDIHHRRSIRLKGYDYSRAGLYFVTICCQNRAHLFGGIINGKMALNDAGEMIEKLWNEIPNDFTDIYLHEYITMPNHIHGIIEIVSAQNAEINEIPVGADSISAHSISARNISGQNHDKKRAEMDSAPTTPMATTTGIKPGLSRIVQSFKRHTTIEYIKNNPIKWKGDKLNGGVGNFVMESSAPYNEENWMV